MRHFIVGLIFVFLMTTANALTIEAERQYGASKDEPDLLILSSTDVDLFDPVLKAYSAVNPDIHIKYTVSSTKEIYETVLNTAHDFDLIMSSAMDLQMKLANDGFAQSLSLANSARVPDWSKWQDSLFGFSLEPIGLVISTTHPIMSDIPTDRRALVSFLRANADILQGKIITYDVTLSGAGFLFATQDERQSKSYWRMAEVMGSLEAGLYCCSGEMLDSIHSGEALLAYNIIGPYAEKRAREQDNLKVVYLQDYTHMLMRTALIPSISDRKELASNFLQFLLSNQGQDFIENRTDMLSLTSALLTENRHYKPIRLDTGLLVYLDKLKKERFLEEWQEALIQ